MVALLALPLAASSADEDHAVDYAPILSRAGIPGEPSLANNCGPGYQGLRVIESAGGLPFAVVRIENRQLVKRTFVRGGAESLTESSLSDSEWTELVGLLQMSGFWSDDSNTGVWITDGAMLWIEVCLHGRFRSISIYPDRDGRMNELIEFLGSIDP